MANHAWSGYAPSAGAPAEIGLLAELVDELAVDDVALSAEFLEMILARVPGDPDAGFPTQAAAELLAEPMTAAEATAANVVTAAARFARDHELSDQSLFRLMALATLHAARFETYLVERTA